MKIYLGPGWPSSVLEIYFRHELRFKICFHEKCTAVSGRNANIAEFGVVISIKEEYSRWTTVPYTYLVNRVKNKVIFLFKNFLNWFFHKNSLLFKKKIITINATPDVQNHTSSDNEFLRFNSGSKLKFFSLFLPSATTSCAE